MKKFRLEPIYTLIDMVPCSNCGSYFEALLGDVLGDVLCNKCSNAQEVQHVMHTYQRSARETLNSDDIVDGDLIDMWV